MIRRGVYRRYPQSLVLAFSSLTVCCQSFGLSPSSTSSSALSVRMSASSSSSCPAESRRVFGKDDALFGCIEAQQRVHGRPFGKVLDAGTGLHSLRWLSTLQEETNKALPMTHLTAVTADETMQRNVQREMEALGIQDDTGEVVMGNWFPATTEKTPSTTDATTSTTTDNGQKLYKDSLVLPHEHYDTILADYLIGAMDGFSPYQQDLILPKLTNYLAPHGLLYIVGLEPIPDKVTGDADIVCRVRQVRDACILLAGHRCYREYPVNWIQRQVQQTAGLKLVDVSRFPILYRHETILKQINVARSKFPFIKNQQLVQGLTIELDALERQSREATQRSPNNRLQLGFDYVVTAEKIA